MASGTPAGPQVMTPSLEDPLLGNCLAVHTACHFHDGGPAIVPRPSQLGASIMLSQVLPCCPQTNTQHPPEGLPCVLLHAETLSKRVVA